jgi:hypothetical protein
MSFLFPFLYKGFIIENFNLTGKIPLVRTLLHIQFRGELMNVELILITWWKFHYRHVKPLI